MVEAEERQVVGPYSLTRPVESSPIGARFLAFKEADQSSHTAIRFARCHDREQMRRFVLAVSGCAQLRHEHVLPVEYHTFDATGHPWVVTPFTGDVDGVRTLTKLLREKKGQVHPFEVERALQHLLEASDYAHRTEPARDGREARLAMAHGPLSMDEVLVDRHGRLVIELYGLGLRLREEPSADQHAETVRDELRSIAEIGYQLLTGLRAEAPMIPPSRLVKRLDSRWDRWLARGLDPIRGFDSAAEALAWLPSRSEVTGEPELELAGGVRGVIGRLRPGRW